MRNRTNSVQIKLLNQAPLPIQLIDNYSNDNDSFSETPTGQQIPRQEPGATGGPASRGNSNSWATNVYIGDCTIVKGSNNYRYVVWTVTIETTTGAKITLYKRYSEFFKLRELLLHYFPKNKVQIGELPPKRYFQNNFDEDFLRKRRTGLEFFLNTVILNPLFSNSPLVKEFVLMR